AGTSDPPPPPPHAPFLLGVGDSGSTQLLRKAAEEAAEATAAPGRRIAILPPPPPPPPPSRGSPVPNGGLSKARWRAGLGGPPCDVATAAAAGTSADSLSPPPPAARRFARSPACGGAASPRQRPSDPAGGGGGSGSGSGAASEIKALQQSRRLLANARERTRVHTISAAFEALRKQVPCYSYGQKLSKLAILRIACNYILSLARLADLDYSGDHSNLSFSECVEQCTRTLQAEGRSKKRKVRLSLSPLSLSLSLSLSAGGGGGETGQLERRKGSPTVGLEKALQRQRLFGGCFGLLSLRLPVPLPTCDLYPFTAPLQSSTGSFLSFFLSFLF
uniref:Protein atonal homolog 8 n=1 Tax=Naja naja TaxID=35670 RepID=A0A8C7DWD7_NAJNA